jgi:hypothetical protein
MGACQPTWASSTAAAQQHSAKIKRKRQGRAQLSPGAAGWAECRRLSEEKKKKKNYSIPLSSSQLPKEEGGTYKSSYFPQQLSSLIRAAHNISKQSRLSVLLRRRFRSLAKGLFRSLSSSSSSSWY